jgi:hypothetical protein
MVSEPHKRTEVLMGHFLDPQRAWNAASDGELRSLMEQSEDAKRLYTDMIILHRLLVGNDAEEPTGFERQQRLNALMDATAEPVEASVGLSDWLGVRFWAFIGSLAVAALAMMMFWPGVDMQEDASLRARGDDSVVDNHVMVGLGISGVTESGNEYEVLASNEAGSNDYFRFYYTNENKDIEHLFIFGLQEGRPVIWYAPLPPEETKSLAIDVGRSIKLPLENRLAARHSQGALKVVALFTRKSILSDTVENAINANLWGLDESAFTEELTRRLGLASEDIIQVLETRIVSTQKKGVNNESH